MYIPTSNNIIFFAKFWTLNNAKIKDIICAKMH